MSACLFTYEQIKNYLCDEKAKELFCLAENCYSDSNDEKKEQAKELWIKAYFTDRKCRAGDTLDYYFDEGWRALDYSEFESNPRFRDRKELEPYAKDGMLRAQYLMGRNLSMGYWGWNIDETEAKKWLKKAINDWHQDSEEFMLKRYGIGKYYIFGYIFREKKICILCESLAINENGKSVLRLWIHNDTKNELIFNAHNICLDGLLIKEQVSLGRLEPDSGKWSNIHFTNLFPKENHCISFMMGIYITNTERIEDLKLSTIKINEKGEVSFSRKTIKDSKEGTLDSIIARNNTINRTTRYETTSNKIKLILSHKPDDSVSDYIEANGWKSLNTRNTRWECKYSEDAVYFAKDFIDNFE